MATTPEGKVKTQVKRLLKEHKIWFYMPVAGPFSAHGIPDFVCCDNGVFLSIETKAPGKIDNLTVNQRRVISEIQEHGGIALVIDNVQQLKEYLDARHR